MGPSPIGVPVLGAVLSCTRLSGCIVREEGRRVLTLLLLYRMGGHRSYSMYAGKGIAEINDFLFAIFDNENKEVAGTLFLIMFTILYIAHG